MKGPWWRKQTQHRYVRHNGKQIRLSEEPDPDGGGRQHLPPAVETAWHKLLARDEPELRCEDLTVQEVFDRFLQTREGVPENGTRWCLRGFQQFVGGSLKASKLRPFYLTDFFKKNPQWGESTKRTITVHILSALNHAVREGLIERNPISATPGFRPHGSYARRGGVVRPELHVKLLAASIPALTTA